MFANLVFSQESISGNITDDEGVPLPGATVLILGTTNGTTSDFDGNFTIQAIIGDVLSFSYVGYETFNQEIQNQDQLSIITGKRRIAVSDKFQFNLLFSGEISDKQNKKTGKQKANEEIFYMIVLWI